MKLCWYCLRYSETDVYHLLSGFCLRNTTCTWLLDFPSFSIDLPFFSFFRVQGQSAAVHATVAVHASDKYKGKSIVEYAGVVCDCVDLFYYLYLFLRASCCFFLASRYALSFCFISSRTTWCLANVVSSDKSSSVSDSSSSVLSSPSILRQ